MKFNNMKIVVKSLLLAATTRAGYGQGSRCYTEQNKVIARCSDGL